MNKLTEMFFNFLKVLMVLFWVAFIGFLVYVNLNPNCKQVTLNDGSVDCLGSNGTMHCTPSKTFVCE